jgi:hypothetical protein
MSIASVVESAVAEPHPWLRLLANWGLGLAGSSCLMPAEARQCPLRPLLSRLTGEEAMSGGRRHVGG